MQTRSFLIVLVLQVASTAHASVAVQCTAPNLVQCVVSEPQGIKKVTVRAETSGGTTVLVDNSYGCVPTATVAFDGASRSSQLEVTTCGGDGVAPKPADGYGEPAYTYSISNGVLRRDDSAGALDIPRPGLVYAALYPLRLANVAHVRQVLQLPALLLGYIAANPTPLPATYYCCTEGAHAHCWPVNALAVCGAGLDFLACDDNSENCKSYPN